MGSCCEIAQDAESLDAATGQETGCFGVSDGYMPPNGMAPGAGMHPGMGMYPGQQAMYSGVPGGFNVTSHGTNPGIIQNQMMAQKAAAAAAAAATSPAK